MIAAELLVQSKHVRPPRDMFQDELKMRMRFNVVSHQLNVNRIRLFASGNVLEAAEAFVKKLVEKCGEQNMSIDQIKSVALEQHADPLNDFALKCRAELREIYERTTRQRK